MPEMVSLEKLMCRSSPWRAFARRITLPWALQGREPSGAGLEIGAGSGVMAAAMLEAFPHLSLTVTDFDASMLDVGRRDLARFGDRATVETADATSLGYEDGRFDFVFSFIMLHHVVEWEKAIAEALRVLRPGGWFVGYDVLSSRTFDLLHRLERAEVRLIRPSELDPLLDELPIDRAILTRAGRAPVMRFRIRKKSVVRGTSDTPPSV